MVARSRRRRGTYDITKTRMLLTTAVFAAVAALYAGGANARIPDEDGSGFEGQLSIVGVAAAQPPSWRGKGGKGEETGGATDPLQRTGVARRGYPELDVAIGTAMANRTAKTAQASIGIAVKAAELTRPCSPQESRTFGAC